MKKITLSITKPILNYGEKLIGVRYEVNQRRDFTGNKILDILKKKGSILKHTFTYGFITDEYIYARITLRIKRPDGKLYDNVVAIKSINGDTDKSVFWASTLGSILSVNRKPSNTDQTSSFIVDIPEPKFFTGGGKLLAVKIIVYDSYYRPITTVKVSAKASQVEVNLSNHAVGDIAIFELEYIFNVEVFVPKSRAYVLLNDKHIPDLIPDRKYVSPTKDTAIRLSYLLGRPKSVSFYLTDPDTGEVLHYAPRSGYELHIPASAVSGYKAVGLTVVAKYDNEKAARLSCSLKVYDTHVEEVME